MSFRNFDKNRFLVIGDIMLDYYMFGSVDRISPEAPVQVFKHKINKEFLGGAANVANNLVSLEQDVSLMSVIGEDFEGCKILKLCKEAGINTDLILQSKSRQTTVKRRLFAENNQQVLRIDHEEEKLIERELIDVIKDSFVRNIASFDLVLISDYAKGFLTDEIARLILKTCSEKNIQVLVDTKDKNTMKYMNCTLMKPNKKELQTFTGNKIDTDDSLIKSGISLKKQIDCKYLLITRGSEGMTYINENNEAISIRAEAKEIYDVTGAGDTVFAYLGLCFANGLRDNSCVKIANIAGGIKVGKIGTSVVTLDEVELELSDSSSKLKTLDKIIRISEHFRKKKKKIVFTNGCFDILHSGHVFYLKKAKMLGDILVVGINSDSSIKKIKGEKRPIIHQKDRVALLEALECIDYIIVFNEDTPLKIIEGIKPDIIVKGGDYKPDTVVGRTFVEQRGGKVKIIPLVNGQSTSNIVSRILSTN